MSLWKSLTTKQDVKDLIISDYSDKTFDELSDLQNEITDSVMPIYNSDVIGEWQAMPSDFDGQGVELYGLPPESEINVYKLMSLDLYAYYSDIVANVIWDLTENGDTVAESENNK